MEPMIFFGGASRVCVCVCVGVCVYWYWYLVVYAPRIQGREDAIGGLQIGRQHVTGKYRILCRRLTWVYL